MKTAYLSALPMILLLALSACSTSSVKRDPEIGRLLEKEVGDLDHSLALKIMAEPYSVYSKSRQKVETEMKEKIWWWLRFYSVRDRERFTRNLERGENYRPLVEQVLGEQGLPSELFYLAMIESGFVNHATSATSAAGIWQFMKPTAVNYGLTLNEPIDERREPVAATQAAARYLADLHRRFNSWYLAIAAFNAGPGRIFQAIREGHTRDFWKLADGGYLPAETMEYLPKFLAAATLGSHLKHFGFEKPKASEPWSEISSVIVKPRTSVSQIARLAGLNQKEVLRYNPNLPHRLVSVKNQIIKVWLPKNAALTFSKRSDARIAKR